MEQRLVIGLTGAFGSGCTFLADNFFVKEFGYKKYSLSSELRKRYEKQYSGKPSRSQLQKFGNAVRKENLQILAEDVDKQIKEVGLDENKSIVIDSIRNPAEIEYFRSKYPEFILIAVFADYDTRWNRIRDEYKGSKDEFDKDEAKDQGNNEPKHGQRITDCFFEADVVISNNSEVNSENHNEAYSEMKNKLINYIAAFSNPLSSNPTVDETLMSMAYAIGRRSKCIKRRVGAVVVDEKKCVLSTGFNSVPIGLKDCNAEHGNCYRDKKRKELAKSIAADIREQSKRDNKSESIAADIKELGESTATNTIELDESNTGDVREQSKVVATEDICDLISSRVKVLELCRALHAEENAIINLVGRSVPQDLKNASLYATTYPCNLCANKIVQVGIKKVIYFEPYPVVEAKKIFEAANVEAVPFEGVTFRAFFRAFNFQA